MTQHHFSAKVTSRSPRGAIKGEILERGIIIGTFKRNAPTGGYIAPIESKFNTERCKARFDDFADCLSIGETIEAIMEG